MRYDVYVTVWGEGYVEKFVDFSLASQLAPGNLPAVADGDTFVYHIYTDRASEPRFHPGIDALARHAEVRFHFYEDIPYRGATLAEAMAASDPATLKHNVQRVTSLHLFAHAAEQGSDAFILLDSDFLFADGAWPALIAAHRAGGRAVCAMFLRLNQDAAPTDLAGRLAAGMAARELVGVGLAAPHPILQSMFVDADPFTAYPSQLNWRMGAHGFVTHCFFPHPLLIAARPGLRYASTMDYELALRAVAEDAAIHLVTRSDELLVCKMTPAAYRAEAAQGGAARIADVARFVVSNTNIRHRSFMARPIRFAAGGPEDDWRDLEARSTRFVEAMYKAAELIVGGARADARSMVFLKSFLGPIEDFLSPQTAARMKGWM